MNRAWGALGHTAVDSRPLGSDNLRDRLVSRRGSTCTTARFAGLLVTVTLVLLSLAVPSIATPSAGGGEGATGFSSADVSPVLDMVPFTYDPASMLVDGWGAGTPAGGTSCASADLGETAPRGYDHPSILALGDGSGVSLGSFGGAYATRAGGSVDDAVGAGGRVGDAVPDPAPVRRPSGAPDRDSPWYVSYRDADGNLQTVGNSGGIHAEVRIQQMEPGAPMSRSFGWRTIDGTSGPQWVPGTVCRDCQRLPRELFPDNIEGAPGGPWDLW